MRNHADLSIFETTCVNANIDAHFRATEAILKGQMDKITGKYTLKPLPPGDYTIKIEAPGFANFTETAVKATMGTNSHLNVGMESD